VLAHILLKVSRKSIPIYCPKRELDIKRFHFFIYIYYEIHKYFLCLKMTTDCSLHSTDGKGKIIDILDGVFFSRKKAVILHQNEIL